MSAGDEIGYGKPPVHTRFRKGQSGNPKGRPRGRKKEPPYEAVLGQMVTIREEGIERRVTAAEAFGLYLTKRGLDGDSIAARQVTAAIEDARAKRKEFPERRKVIINFVSPTPRVISGSLNAALETLRMARKGNSNRDPAAQLTLEPWIVQMALDRLGSRRLELSEQHTVLRATRNPEDVRWPDWWEALPDARHNRRSAPRRSKAEG